MSASVSAKLFLLGQWTCCACLGRLRLDGDAQSPKFSPGMKPNLISQSGGFIDAALLLTGCRDPEGEFKSAEASKTDDEFASEPAQKLAFSSQNLHWSHLAWLCSPRLRR
jgi:hypothetical protein